MKYKMNAEIIISKISRHHNHSTRDLSIMVGGKDASDAKVIHSEKNKNINNCDDIAMRTMITPAIPRQMSHDVIESKDRGLPLSSSKKRIREICATTPFMAGAGSVR